MMFYLLILFFLLQLSNCFNNTGRFLNPTSGFAATAQKPLEDDTIKFSEFCLLIDPDLLAYLTQGFEEEVRRPDEFIGSFIRA